MSRDYLVSQYNHYVDKRNSYIDKIHANEDVISAIESGFDTCMTYVDQLGAYIDYANIFKQVHEHNQDDFSEDQKSYIIGILNEVGIHLETERADAQSQINYWQDEIDDYDREHQDQEDS